MWIVVEKKASAPLKKVIEDMPWIFLKKKKGGLWIEREHERWIWKYWGYWVVEVVGGYNLHGEFGKGQENIGFT